MTRTKILCGSALLTISLSALPVSATARAVFGGNQALVQQAYLKASNTGVEDLFGRVVAISGDTLVVGAWSEDGNAKGVNGNNNNSALDSGAVYVFVRSGNTWKQQAYLKPSNTETDDEFGRVVAISGDTLVVGAPMEDGGSTGVNGNDTNNGSLDSGAAYVFVRNGGVWTQQAYLKASNTGNDDRFGDAVSIHGETIVVGAPQEDSSATGVNGNTADNSAGDSGAAYVFVRNGSTWTQQAYLKASNTGAVDHFGNSVAIHNNTIVVGAPEEDSDDTGVNGTGNDNNQQDSGAAYVYVRSGNSWTLEAFLKASNTESGDAFGNSVALDGDTVVCSATGENSSATGVGGNEGNNSADDAGAAYVFVRNGSNWSQEAYLKPSNTEANDQFGWSLAIQGNTLVAGARFEDSSATGVDGDATNNGAPDSGAAYVFVRSGAQWSQSHYLKAHNTNDHDRFGYGVGIDGTTIVAGALGESSSEKGTNGTGINNKAFESGAVYIFDLAGTMTLQLKKGALADSASAGKDTFQASATYSMNSSSPDATLNPSQELLQLALGPADQPLNITIPAFDVGWKATPAGTPVKFTWKSAKGATPVVQVVVDTKKKTIDIKVSKFDWAAAPVAPMGFTIIAGNDDGAVTGAWISKKAGQFVGP